MYQQRRVNVKGGAKGKVGKRNQGSVDYDGFGAYDIAVKGKNKLLHGKVKALSGRGGTPSAGTGKGWLQPGKGKTAWGRPWW